MLQNTIKWSLLITLAGGLTSCFMYDQDRNDHMQAPVTYEQQATVKHAKGTKTAMTKAASSSDKGPVQQYTPGPKRAAAPQLPVIQ